MSILLDNNDEKIIQATLEGIYKLISKSKKFVYTKFKWEGNFLYINNSLKIKK